MAAANDNEETQYADTPEGWAQRWQMELAASRKELKKWQEQGDKILKRFRAEQDNNANASTRWNLFSANIQTQRAMLYGQTPKVTVTRRFADSADDSARAAAEFLERLLNTDIERKNDSFAIAMQHALDDRLLVGMGNVRVRYVADFEDGEETPAITKQGPDGEPVELAPAIPPQQTRSNEEVEVDYIHWKDQLWSPSRTFGEVRWWAFRAEMSREELAKRFGDAMAKLIPLNAKRNKRNSDNDSQKNDPWSRAEVWEIWDKEHDKVFWYVEGFAKVLDQKDDPLELEGFWPFPRPMFSNLTTSALVPRADFVLAQDLYNEIDNVSDRITKLEEAIKVIGVYDKTAGPEVARLINEAANNQLIPVENWMGFAEKGGLKGVVDWFPVEPVVMAMDKLREYRTELIGALYQITGMSDIMRGQASETGITATEQSIKARFASVRMQSLQDEFARFASDVQSIKAEIIANMFEPQTILERSNAQYTFDAPNAMQAIDLIKSQYSCYRIEVKPEAVSLTDFAQLKAERTEFIGAVSTFLQAAAPLAQAIPGSMSFLLQILQWSMTGLRGSSTIEAVMDRAIQQSEQAAMAPQPPPPPDPKLQAQQLKAQTDLAKTQADLQAHLIGIKAETDANFQRQRDQTMWNIREQQARSQIKHAQSPGATPAFSAPDYGGGT